MVKFILKKSLFGLLFFMVIIQGCSDEKAKKSPESSQQTKVHTIDLFPKERLIYDNTGKLSIDEAFQISQEVVYAGFIKKIDSSQTRGVKPFYIYQVTEGRFEKTSDAKKNKLPLLFLSEQKLFRGKTLNDSVYLFLEPLQQYKLLKKNQDIRYKWVNNAPFR